MPQKKEFRLLLRERNRFVNPCLFETTAYFNCMKKNDEDDARCMIEQNALARCAAMMHVSRAAPPSGPARGLRRRVRVPLRPGARREGGVSLTDVDAAAGGARSRVRRSRRRRPRANRR